MLVLAFPSLKFLVGGNNTSVDMEIIFDIKVTPAKGFSVSLNEEQTKEFKRVRIFAPHLFSPLY